MPAGESHDREAVLKRIVENLSANAGFLTLEQAYDVFKEIEAEMRVAEDHELYDALLAMRKELQEAMEARAQELGKSEDWAQAMKGHDTMLMLRPLFPAQNNAEEYMKAFRALSPEQIVALEYWEKETGTHLVRPGIFEAELRWNSIRRGSILRLIPDPELARTWSERLIAILPGLVLAVGLAFAVENKSWATALVLLALLLVVAATWTRDFVSFMRKSKSHS
jgi:hypothetical protein